MRESPNAVKRSACVLMGPDYASIGRFSDGGSLRCRL